ncbi:hypothetical protein [Bacillus mycoides]
MSKKVVRVIDWNCEACNHTETSGLFETWIGCPVCGCEEFLHDESYKKEVEVND